MDNDFVLDDKYVLNGVRDDTRTNEQKTFDFGAEELDFGKPEYSNVAYLPNLISKSQAHTYSCVPSSHCFAQELMRRPDCSRLYLYRQRNNYPDQGMSPQECANRFYNTGTVPYSMLPNVDIENEANEIVLTPEMKVEADKLRSSYYFTFKNNQIDIDHLTGIATFKPPIICIYASLDEWGDKYVTRKSTKVTLDNAPVRHSITIYQRSSFIKDGKKWITCGDSAYFGGFPYRYLDEDFIKERVYNALYYTSLNYLNKADDEYKPKHTFPQNIIKYGDRSEDVAWLQKCLQHEKLFPIGANDHLYFVTGNFYGLTLKAVKDFQLRYKDDILVPAGLKEPTGVVGKYTIKKLNELFS